MRSQINLDLRYYEWTIISSMNVVRMNCEMMRNFLVITQATITEQLRADGRLHAVRHIIYEPFSGSDTTIIAAESCRRRCYTIELNPEYVDMAMRCWEEYTGQQAILDGDGHTFAEVSEIRSEACE